MRPGNPRVLAVSSAAGVCALATIVAPNTTLRMIAAAGALIALITATILERRDEATYCQCAHTPATQAPAAQGSAGGECTTCGRRARVRGGEKVAWRADR